MTEIRSYHDKIAELKEYLVLNRNDEEGDSWIFGHNPTIENHLSSLNENEINELIDEIFTWDELERHHIADPISDTKNKFIDAQYVYGKIFLSIKDFEKLEYCRKRKPRTTVFPRAAAGFLTNPVTGGPAWLCWRR